MGKNLVLGFVGTITKGRHRISQETIAKLIRENYPLGYKTVLTGIDGAFEMSCANAVLRLRAEGLDIKLSLAVTETMYEVYKRFVRDERALNDAQLIISRADDVQIIKGSSSLLATIKRDKHIIDASDLLYYYADSESDRFRCKKIAYDLSLQPQKNCCNLSEKSARSFVMREASLRYIRLHDHTIMSNEIDKIYLNEWIVSDNNQLKKYFKNPEATAVQLLRETGDNNPNLLPMRVFFYVFVNSLVLRISDPAMYWQNSRNYFNDFQEILRIIRLARANNIKIPNFNIFNFTGYKQILHELLKG